MYKLKEMTMINKAHEDTLVAHNGQTRKDGITPYYVHPMRVATLLIGAGCPATVVCAGYGHDLIEDRPEYNIDHWHGQSKSLISLVTKEKGETKEDAIKKIRFHKWAIMIKMGDRIDNYIGDLYSDFSGEYLKKESVIESTLELLIYAKERGLEKTNLFKRLGAIIKDVR